jgi:flagellar hook assembly protein FlgD
MSSLLNIYFKKEDLQKMLNASNDKGLSVTVSVNDVTNQWGQNCTAFISQTKEQRDNKSPKIYVGNGSVVFTDGNIVKAESKERPQPANESNKGTDLPF